MTISHHLSDVTLQDYAAGALDNTMEVVIACHLTLCPACRRRSNLADGLGGVVLSNGASTAPRISALELLAKEPEYLESQQQQNVEKHDDEQSQYNHQPESHFATDVPRPLGRLLPTQLDSLDWKRIAPGIKQFNLSSKSRREGAFKLLHLDPGVVLSEHTHQDRELTLVLRGSYQDEIGRFKKGDIADLDDHVVHQPVVDTDEPCIALIATLSPVRFSGMLGRLLQPFVGI